MSQQCVRADVEGHAEKRVGRALIELAVEDRGISPTVREGFLLLDLELKQSVTRREVDVCQPRDLIDAVAFWVVTAERAPEISVDRAKVTSFASEAARVFIVSPFLPNIHTARAQVRFVRIA